MIGKLIENFKNIKIAVIGDLMLDEYIMGKVDRISPEAPVPVVKVTEEKFVLGGAANVINNLASLGADVYCGGLVGKDNNAEKLINAFPKNVDCNLILKVENRPTIVKKRVIAGHQQLLRLDWEEEFYINEDEEKIIIENLKNHIKNIDAIILSDYNKGLLTKSLSQKIINLCRENNVIITVDPKPKNISNFVGASSITPNKKEAYAAVDANVLENIDVVGEKLKKKYNLDTVLITRSEEGMTLYDKEIHNIPTYAKEVYDVTGAGDTVISVFTLAKAAGATWEEAAKIANAAGGIVVGKIGSSTVSEKELNAVILSDYNKGLLTKSLSQKIINLCRENNVIVTVDPKPKNISNFVGASSITPNKKEAYAAVEANLSENIDIVGEKLKEKYNLDTVLVTRSEEGMTLYDKKIHNIPTYAKEVYDVTGAGDTVISVFTLAKAAGATWEEAAKIANTAGGIVVGKIGTSTVSEKELIETYNSIYNTGDVCKC